MKPFYSKARGELIIDAVCICGHAESEHGSKLHKFPNIMIREANASNCSDCDCEHFTWAGWLTLKDMKPPCTKAASCHFGH